MSTADELRKLDSEIKQSLARDGRPFSQAIDEYLDVIRPLRQALPEIIAVVEAAESLRLDARGGLCDDPFHSKGDKLDSALGRLTAKLGEA